MTVLYNRLTKTGLLKNLHIHLGWGWDRGLGQGFNSTYNFSGAFLAGCVYQTMLNFTKPDCTGRQILSLSISNNIPIPKVFEDNKYTNRHCNSTSKGRLSEKGHIGDIHLSISPDVHLFICLFFCLSPSEGPGTAWSPGALDWWKSVLLKCQQQKKKFYLMV